MLKVTKSTDGKILLLSTKEIDKIYKVGTDLTVVNYGKGQSITVTESLAAIQNSTGPRDCILVTYKDSPSTQGLFFFHNIKSIEAAGTGSRVLFNATNPIVVLESISALAAQIAATVPPGSQDADFYRVGTTTAPTNIAQGVYRTGDVAIGLGTPLKKLHVNGNARDQYSDVDGVNYFRDFGNGCDVIALPTQLNAMADTLWIDVSNYAYEMLFNSNQTQIGGSGTFVPSKILEFRYDYFGTPISYVSVTNGSQEINTITDPISLSQFDHRSNSIYMYVTDSVALSNSSISANSGASIMNTADIIGQAQVKTGSGAAIMQVDENTGIYQNAVVLNTVSVYQYAIDQALEVASEMALFSTSARIAYYESNTGITNRFEASTTAAEIVSINNLLQSAKVGTKQNIGNGSPGVYMEPIEDYLDNAAALSAGLQVNSVYRTGDFLKIVH